MAEQLVTQINEKLGRLASKADELQNLSQRNQQALVNPDGPIMQAINAVRERISNLAPGIQRIVDSKASLERLIRDTDVNLGALEQRLTETIREIDVQPLLDQLRPLNDELDRISQLIDAQGVAPAPGAAPGAAPGPGADAGQQGGYIIPSHKRRSTRRSTKRKSKGGGKKYKSRKHKKGRK
jgi:DNA repair exonuclease SbcCD ATPase subunit